MTLARADVDSGPKDANFSNTDVRTDKNGGILIASIE